METEQVTKQIAGMFTIAEKHQATVEQLQGTASQQQEKLTALFSQIDSAVNRMSMAANNVGSLPESVRKAVREEITSQQRPLGDSLKAMLKEAVGEAARTAASEASRSVTDAMAEARTTAEAAARAAKQAETTARNSAQWMTWKWAGITLACLVVLGILPYVYVQWLNHTITKQKATIETQKSTIDDLSKKGGSLALSTCGDKGRLCVEIDKQELSVAYESKDGKHHYRIPTGY